MGCCLAAAYMIAFVMRLARSITGRPDDDMAAFAPPATRPAPQPEAARNDPFGTETGETA